MWGISTPTDLRPMGYKLSCCRSIWSREEPFSQICSNTGRGSKTVCNQGTLGL